MTRGRTEDASSDSEKLRENKSDQKPAERGRCKMEVRADFKMKQCYFKSLNKEL